MKIGIIDYANWRVDIIENAPDMEKREDVENYLTNTLHYDPDEISFIFGNTKETCKLSVTFLTPDDFV